MEYYCHNGKELRRPITKYVQNNSMEIWKGNNEWMKKERKKLVGQHFGYSLQILFFFFFFCFYGLGLLACSNWKLTFEAMSPFRHLVRLHLGGVAVALHTYTRQHSTEKRGHAFMLQESFEPTSPVFVSPRGTSFCIYQSFCDALCKFFWAPRA